MRWSTMSSHLSRGSNISYCYLSYIQALTYFIEPRYWGFLGTIILSQIYNHNIYSNKNYQSALNRQNYWRPSTIICFRFSVQKLLQHYSIHDGHEDKAICCCGSWYHKYWLSMKCFRMKKAQTNWLPEVLFVSMEFNIGIVLNVWRESLKSMETFSPRLWFPRHLLFSKGHFNFRSCFYNYI